MWEMPVFSKEKKLGLADVIRAKSSISYACQVKPSTLNQTHIQKALEPIIAKADKKQFDLYYLDTILVTTGWNKNDDIFERPEVWSARASAKDKPFNYQHKQNDIIGHITDSYAVNLEYSPLDNALASDELPEKFHLLNSAVIYKVLDDAERQERIDKVIAEIEEGKWFVSMECLFFNFDYGVITPDGENKIIARNEESSVLTQHLRAYGGTGEVNGWKVGRALRNITFCGKGLVEHPANDESIIFNNVEKFIAAKSNSVYIDLSEGFKSQAQELVMPDVEKPNAELETVKAEKDSLVTANTGLKSEVDSLKATITSKDSEIKTLNDSVASLTAKLNEYKTAQRVEAFVKLNAPADEAAALVKKYEKFDDEAFAGVVTLAENKWKAVEAPKAEPTPEPDKVVAAAEPEKSEAAPLNQPDNAKAEEAEAIRKELMAAFAQEKK